MIAAHTSAIHELLGPLSGWLLLLLAAFVAWRISRGGGGTAVQELSAANQVLEKRVHELGGEVRDLRVENTALRARTDFQGSLAASITPLRESMERHELGAQERNGKVVEVLETISTQLEGRRSGD